MAVTLNPSTLPDGYQIRATRRERSINLELTEGRGNAAWLAREKQLSEDEFGDDAAVTAAVAELAEYAVALHRASSRVAELNKG